MPVSFAESGVTGTPDRRQHGGLRVRKGVVALVYLEGWWDLRFLRGAGRAFEREQHEQDSRAQVRRGVWGRESRRFLWEYCRAVLSEVGRWGLEGRGNKTVDQGSL